MWDIHQPTQIVIMCVCVCVQCVYCLCMSVSSLSVFPALQLTPLTMLIVEFNSENSSVPNHYKDLIHTYTHAHINNHTHMHSEKETQTHRERERTMCLPYCVVDVASWWRQSCSSKGPNIIQILTKQHFGCACVCVSLCLCVCSDLHRALFDLIAARGVESRGLLEEELSGCLERLQGTNRDV